MGEGPAPVDWALAERIAVRVAGNEPFAGSYHADSLVPALRARLTRVADRLAPEQPLRTALTITSVTRSPFYCSGCPHNRSTTAVPDGALVGAGIGCHTMALLMDPDQVGDIAGITCMGNEGTQWIGMAPFVDRAHMAVGHLRDVHKPFHARQQFDKCTERDDALDLSGHLVCEWIR